MLKIQEQVIKQIEKKENISFFKKKIMLFKLKRTVKKINKIRNDIFELDFIGDSFPYLIDKMDEIKKGQIDAKYSKENYESKLIEDFANCETYILLTYILLEYKRMENLYEKALSLILRELYLIIRKGDSKRITIEIDDSLVSTNDYFLTRDGILNPKTVFDTLRLDDYKKINIELERLIYEELK